MKINVSAALKRPGISVEFDCSKTIESIIVAGEKFEFISPLKVIGTMMHTGEDFIVKGQVKAKYKALCNRCSAVVINDLQFGFMEEFSKQEDEDYPDRYVYANNDIDLEVMLINNISLMIPMKHVCTEDCKGLCPVCGGNLNDKDCNCIEDKIMNSSPFAKIKEIYFDEDNREV